MFGRCPSRLCFSLSISQQKESPSPPPAGEVRQRCFNLGRWLGEMFGGRNGSSDDEGNG